LAIFITIPNHKENLRSKIMNNKTWNVYKIFNNGRRAKAPLYHFDCSIEKMNENYFENDIKPFLIKKFGHKIKDSTLTVVRSDLSQTRETSENKFEQEKKLRYKVFSKYLNKNLINNQLIECVLLFAKDTNWKWRWCVVRASTSGIIEIISPERDSYEEAHEWMEKEIEKL